MNISQLVPGRYMTGRLTIVLTALVLVSALCAAPQTLRAEPPLISITEGHIKPAPIAIPQFKTTGESPGETVTSQDITRVVTGDLERSGLFKAVDPRAFIQTDLPLNLRPNFEDWRVIGAEFLVQGKVQTVADGRLRVEFRLWDVARQKALDAQAYHAQPATWRRIAHKIADRIYQQLTGESGYFDSQIVYIAQTGPKTSRIKRLAIMDQDGANHKVLTPGEGHSKLILTPRFSPTAREITYLSYYRGVPRVYLFNIDTGRQERLGDFPGMTFAPRFSPDGNSVIMSMAERGNTEIYAMDLRTRRTERLTRHPAIDTSPSYSADGQFITFNSDRGGSQQIYVMNADGSNVHRISFGDGRYATPVWSPRGDLIAFTKMSKGRFYIGVMRPDGSSERILDDGWLVEAPTWAPNGRVLMYFEQTRGNRQGTGEVTRLYSIDLTGYNKRMVVTPQDASDPAWSGLLP